MHSLYVSKKPCQHLLSDNNAHILCKEWLKSCNLSYFMQGSLSVSQSELHPMRIKFPYSLVCVLSLTRYIYAQKINERDLLHAHSSVGVSYLHADPQCIYSSWDSFFKMTGITRYIYAEKINERHLLHAFRKNCDKKVTLIMSYEFSHGHYLHDI